MDILQGGYYLASTPGSSQTGLRFRMNPAPRLDKGWKWPHLLWRVNEVSKFSRILCLQLDVHDSLESLKMQWDSQSVSILETSHPWSIEKSPGLVKVLRNQFCLQRARKIDLCIWKHETCQLTFMADTSSHSFLMGKKQR